MGGAKPRVRRKMHVCRRAGLLTRNGNWKQRPRHSVAQETDGRRFQATFKLHNREMSSGTRAQRNYLRTANSASVPGSSLNPQRIHHCSWTPGPAQLHTTPLGNFHIPTDEGSTSEGDTNEKNGEGVKTEHVGASLPSTQAQEVMPDNEEKRWSTTSDPIRDQLLSGARNETESDGDSDLSKKGTGGYSLEELLDRIAKAQLQTDEHMVETQFISEKKRPKIRRKTLMTIDELVNFLREENAHDMCVLKIPPEREYVDYFVVCGGLGTRHIRMMADNLVAEVRAV